MEEVTNQSLMPVEKEVSEKLKEDADKTWPEVDRRRGQRRRFAYLNGSDRRSKGRDRRKS